ncbi:MAG: hypothetical protein INH41_25850 [Myxococcaceae bacterium]|nr:hypothetical protein [Myxococcaceae bacterium]MCA3015826.1 hypothetical protein [Myxococcaceae bacterium]
MARVVSERHVAIARLLLRRGALVDESVLADLDVEQVGTAPEAKLRELLDAASRGGC